MKNSTLDTCRIFILSPANSTGRRADILLNPRAEFDLALRFHKQGAPIGEVFSFLSGLYFQGKLAYANCFARIDANGRNVFVITSDRGLVSPETTITPADLHLFKKIPIDCNERRYVEPLTRSARRLNEQIPINTEIILLGSVGTKKYATPLLQIFGPRLKFPLAFVGRGDMSRGGLLLRSIDEMQELDYILLDGAIVHGKRPPKLQKRILPSSRRE